MRLRKKEEKKGTMQPHDIHDTNEAKPSNIPQMVRQIHEWNMKTYPQHMQN